jgi:hypothetical protein
MEDAVGVASNGWVYWEVEGTKERLDTIRQRYLEQDPHDGCIAME